MRDDIAKRVILEEGKKEQGIKNIELLATVFRVLLEERRMDCFDEYFDKSVRIEQNFREPMGYEDVRLFGEKEILAYEKVQFLPFLLAIACGNTVTVCFDRRSYKDGELAEMSKFTSIFEFAPNNKIRRITETSVQMLVAPKSSS